MPFDGDYLNRNRNIIKTIIDKYGSNFFGKKILDLGCGTCGISGALARMGANITAIDVRQEHLDIVKKSYPSIKTNRLDLDKDWPFVREKFDIILALGILDHVKNPKDLILKIANAASGIIIIESEIIDSSDPNKFVYIEEHKSVDDWGWGNIVCKFSQYFVEEQLNSYKLSFDRIDNKSLNTNNSKYDWAVSNSGKRDINQKRFWLVSVGDASKEFIKPPPQIQNQIQIVHPKVMISPQNNIHNQQQIIPGIKRYGEIPNLKIAVALSGHLRSFERCAASLMNFILGSLKKNADFHLNFWETVEGKIAKNGTDLPSSKIKSDTKLDIINNIYNPKSLKIEDYGIYDTLLADMDSKAKLSQNDKVGFFGGSLIQYASMLYSIKNVKEQIEGYEKSNNMTYDMIIRVRFDEQFLNFVNISNYVIGNRIYVPSKAKYYDPRIAVNDQVAIGDGRSMKIYMDLFDHLVDYINRRVNNLLRPEVILKHHLVRNGIQIIDDNINYQLVRSNGEIQRI